MRTICDVCGAAAAAVFCAADEAALCGPCDEKVHTCNKLTSRHIRLRLAEPSAVGRCDICEKSPAFFFCPIDGSSLCLECDIIVHVGSKHLHERFLLLRQKIEISGDKSCNLEDLVQHRKNTDHKLEHNGQFHQKRLVEYTREKMGSCRLPPISMSQLHINHDRHDPAIFDYNSRPQRLQEQVIGSSQVHFTQLGN